MKKVFYFLSFFPLILNLMTLTILPKYIPMHYNIKFEVDRYGSKYEIMLLPAIILIMLIVTFLVMRKLTKENKDIKPLLTIISIFLLVFNILNLIIVFSLIL